MSQPHARGVTRGISPNGLYLVDRSDNGLSTPAESKDSGVIIPQTWATLLVAFDIYLRAANRSSGTIRLYDYRISDLALQVPRPSDVTADLLLERLARATAAETKKSIRTAYRAFFSWAKQTGGLAGDPSANLPPITVPPGKPRPAPEAVVRRSARAADPRERFMIMLGAYAGLRCCEIARAHSRDWDGQDLRVLGKGGKVRAVPIAHVELVDELDRLEGYAFPNRSTGLPLSAGYVSRLLSRALEQTWTGHTLRHRFGTVSLEGTKDLLAVGEVMGHSRPETTKRYCVVGRDRLRAVAAAATA